MVQLRKPRPLWLPDGISGALFPAYLPEFENQPEIVIKVGLWFLSSFFGNYFSGLLGTFWELMPHEAFFLMLVGLGGGVAIRLLGRPLERIVAGHEGTDPASRI